MAHKHWAKDDPAYERAPFCDLPTKKACDERYADWSAMQSVILAYNIAVRPDGTRPYRKDKGVFAQLVLYIAGELADITNDDGNQSQAPLVKRLRAAIERFKSGDLPVYCLYRPVPPATHEGG